MKAETFAYLGAAGVFFGMIINIPTVSYISLAVIFIALASTI